MSNKHVAVLSGQTRAQAPLPFLAYLTGVVATWRARQAYRKAEAELSSLDDRMLRDIGIHRSEISSVLSDRSGERLRSRAPNLQPRA